MEKTDKLTKAELQELKEIQRVEVGLGLVIELVARQSGDLQYKKYIFFAGVKKRLGITVDPVHANSQTGAVKWDEPEKKQ